MIVDLVIKNTNYKIFRETLELGIALLEGGNTVIQVCTDLLMLLQLLSYLGQRSSLNKYCIQIFLSPNVSYIFEHWLKKLNISLIVENFNGN